MRGQLNDGCSEELYFNCNSCEQNHCSLEINSVFEGIVISIEFEADQWQFLRSDKTESNQHQWDQQCDYERTFKQSWSNWRNKLSWDQSNDINRWNSWSKVRKETIFDVRSWSQDTSEFLSDRVSQMWWQYLTEMRSEQCVGTGECSAGFPAEWTLTSTMSETSVETTECLDPGFTWKSWWDILGTNIYKYSAIT
jgi:hypothetical protein